MNRPAQLNIEALIVTVRSQRVILDAELAGIYNVSTKALNQAVKRNSEKFPRDFVFRLSRAETDELVSLRSQNVTSKIGRGGRRYLPYAFTEHGAIMAANVLNSASATRMSVFVVRAFVKMRSIFSDSRELSRKLTALESELKSRLDVHEAAIVEILQRVMKILDPPPPPPEAPPPEIGFHVKEDCVAYRIKRRRISGAA